jgi:hypothetical protein
MAKRQQTESRKTEEFILQAVEVLRNNPKKYAAVRKALKTAKTDKARVKSLLKFATSDQELAALMPSQGEETHLGRTTTITITTVLIPAS